MPGGDCVEVGDGITAVAHLRDSEPSYRGTQGAHV